MKVAALVSMLVLSANAFATVVELEDATARSVIEVYEEMREEEVASDNKWIHDFEEEPVGSEMDHLSDLKRTATYEEM